MAFYLQRAFADKTRVLVLNDLRLVDSVQPEFDGSAGVCQIDHLVLHRWGAFIIESKSVTEEVSVRDDGAGGDEWTRTWRGREQGFPSPIQQARRQAEFLRAFLDRNREKLLGRVPVGLRTLAKILRGDDQRTFAMMPIQIIVAISDCGKIRRVNRWKEPTEPFRTFVSKADLVTEKIRDELLRHKGDSTPLGDLSSDYGKWCMKQDEVGSIAEFLTRHHTPPRKRATQPPPPIAPVAMEAMAKPVEKPTAQPARTWQPPTCKSCAGSSLTAHWGKYGYYWKCGECGTNTSMPTVCVACGAEGLRGKIVRIRKENTLYYRCCDACGIEERIWTQASP